MKFFKILICVPFFILQIIPLTAWCQALPVAEPQKVGRAISQTMSDVMTRRGIAANDPRFARTLARIGPVLKTAGATGAAITVGALTAPGWVSAALIIGVGIGIGYAIELAIDATVKWLFRTDGTIDYSKSPVDVNSFKAIEAGQPTWSADYFVKEEFVPGDPERSGIHWIWGTDGIALFTLSQLSWESPFVGNCYYDLPTEITCDDESSAEIGSDGPDKSCPAGYIIFDDDCMPVERLSQKYTGRLHKASSPQKAIDALPESLRQQKLNPKIIAALVDQAWKTAAEKPGYDGVPYSVTDPVTVSDANISMQQHPNEAPTVGDFVAPNPATSAEPAPWSIPTTPLEPTPNTDADPATDIDTKTDDPKQSKIDLGPDPGIGSPSLEATPTAQQILQPISGVTANLRDFQVAPHSGACPVQPFNYSSKHTHSMPIAS